MTARRSRLVLILACAALAATASCNRARARTFASPDEAVKALMTAAGQEKPDELLAIFGPDAQELVQSSEPDTARRNRQVFVVAMAEGWRLVDNAPAGKLLVVGNEGWPFPVPIVQDRDGWKFDTAAGRDEVMARRIGRNELAVIGLCRTYVAAQRIYAQRGHDGRPAGRYATAFRSDPGKQNGLYWAASRGEKRSPLGDLVAAAAEDGQPLPAGAQPAPFHGYRFAILTAQSAAASGGAREYVVDGEMTGGFALVAWPAQYGTTGIMTFVVGQDGVVREKDLGASTDESVKPVARYDPDASWTTSN